MEFEWNRNRKTRNRSLCNGSDPDFPKVSEPLLQELDQLMQQRIEVMRRIDTVKQMIVGLTYSFGNDLMREDSQWMVRKQ